MCHDVHMTTRYFLRVLYAFRTKAIQYKSTYRAHRHVSNR